MLISLFVFHKQLEYICLENIIIKYYPGYVAKNTKNGNAYFGRK
jgi:hypothetical protein